MGFSSGDHIGCLCGYSQSPSSTVPAAASAGLGTSTKAQINKPFRKSTHTQILSWCRPTVESEGGASTQKLAAFCCHFLSRARNLMTSEFRALGYSLPRSRKVCQVMSLDF